jgi:hypothetical protein
LVSPLLPRCKAVSRIFRNQGHQPQSLSGLLAFRFWHGMRWFTHMPTHRQPGSATRRSAHTHPYASVTMMRSNQTALARKTPTDPRSIRRAPTALGAIRARRKFLSCFPGGFRDETYLAWERDYKWTAHTRWQQTLNRAMHHALIQQRRFREIAARVVSIESRTNLLFSFEKMALRDAVRSPTGARRFAVALYDFLYAPRNADGFERWCDAIAALPRKQTRVLTWPVVTVFGFLADPKTHIFLKPNVTRTAAAAYGSAFEYESHPSWETYASLLAFAARIRRDIRDLRPRDMIDIQSFIWVQGSDEYR